MRSLGAVSVGVFGEPLDQLLLVEEVVGNHGEGQPTLVPDVFPLL